jgi:hypothetical protein
MIPGPNDVKQGSPTMTKAAFQDKVTDFSLVMGGPLFQLFRKTHLTGDHLELLRRRVLTIVSIAWLPMLVLDLVAPDMVSQAGLPFFMMLRYRPVFLSPFQCSFWLS